MPDRYDPKFSVRPPGDRKPAEPTDEIDPLAELARIVSGRPAHEPSATATARGKAPGGPPVPEPDVEQDLEAELLNDLQASFAAIREPLESASAGATSAPEEDPEPDVSDSPSAPPDAEPPPPIEAAPEPPRRSEAPTFDISHAFEENAFAPIKPPRPETPSRETAPAARDLPARKDPPIDPEAVARSYVNPLRGPAALAKGDLPKRVGPPPRPTPPVHATPPVRAADQGSTTARAGMAPPTRAERGSPPAPPKAPPPRRPPPPPSRAAAAHIPVRPLAGEEPRVVEPARPVGSGPGRSDSPPLPSRFAPRPPAAVAQPPRRPAAPAAQPEPPPEDDFDLSNLAGEMEGPYEDDFVLDDVDAAYADDAFPPFPEDELESLKRRRTGRVFAVVAAMLAVVAIGGAAIFLYRSDAANGGPPPIITADSSPTKVQPDDAQASDGEAPSKLIYDRVAESGEGTDTRLVTSNDTDIGNIPADDTDVANNPISRVIIPGGPGVDEPGADGGDGAAIADGSASEEQSDIGPRMVRTVVVKPDGTIVSSEATGVDDAGNPLPSPADESGDFTAATEIPPPQRSEMDAVLEGGDLPVNLDPLSNPSEPATAAVDEPEPIPEPPSEPAQITESQPADEPPPAPAAPEPAAAAPEPAPEPPPQRTAARQPANGPIDLTPGTAPARGGGVLVQVTAQRSEQAAESAYRGLQQRYPNILGSFQARVVRADLGEKGVYYRVRIGPFSEADATRLCGDLKAAGGDCLLAR